MKKNKVKVLINYILILFLVSIPQTLSAKLKYFVGVEPQFSREEWYDKDELNINILPFVFEKALNGRSGLRFRSHTFLHTGGKSEASISLVGIGASWLYYFNPQTDNDQYQGLNIGPAAIFTNDFLDNIIHSTTALETGYAFIVSNNWTLNVAMQNGISIFSGDKNTSSYHFGIYVNFGFWF